MHGFPLEMHDFPLEVHVFPLEMPGFSLEIHGSVRIYRQVLQNCILGRPRTILRWTELLPKNAGLDEDPVDPAENEYFEEKSMGFLLKSIVIDFLLKCMDSSGNAWISF